MTNEKPKRQRKPRASSTTGGSRTTRTSKPKPETPTAPPIQELPAEERRKKVNPAANLSDGAELIGGHLGVDVYRDGNRIVKQAWNRQHVEAVKNEARMLRALEGTGVAPLLLVEGDDWISEFYLDGENVQKASEADRVFIEDGERFRREAVRFLVELRRASIRHGDATPPNLVVDPGDRLLAVDWQEAHLFEEPIKDRHQLSDSHLIWRTVGRIPSRMHPIPDTPRLIRRWQAISGDLGGSTGVDQLESRRLLDLGCFMGDLAMMAAADGMEVVAADASSDAIENGRHAWAAIFSPAPPPNVQWLLRDAVAFTPEQFGEFEAVVMLSTWAYIVRDYGREAAERVLDNITASGATLYFETQLHGDGPGVDFHKTDEDVLQFLSQFGDVRPIAEKIPVTGRPALRTTWRVKR